MSGIILNKLPTTEMINMQNQFLVHLKYFESNVK